MRLKNRDNFFIWPTFLSCLNSCFYFCRMMCIIIIKINIIICKYFIKSSLHTLKIIQTFLNLLNWNSNRKRNTQCSYRISYIMNTNQWNFNFFDIYDFYCSCYNYEQHALILSRIVN